MQRNDGEGVAIATRQETLTVRAEVLAGQERALDRALDVRARPFATGSLFDHGELRIHFARLTFLEEPEGSAFPSALLMNVNFDTELDDSADARGEYLKTLAGLRARELGDVFRHCRGFEGEPTPEKLAKSWSAHLIDHTVRYQGHVLRDLARVRSERRIADAARAHVGRMKTPRSNVATWKSVRDHVLSPAGMADGVTAEDQRSLLAPPHEWPEPRRANELLSRSLPAAYAAAAPRELAMLGLRAFDIIGHERKDVEFDPHAWLERRDALEDARKAATEDFATQNALTHVAAVRDDGGRAGLLRVAHAVIAAAAKNHFDWTGELGGIPTIHFAEWLLTDDGKRLVFFSNYDGNWESYIGDFVDQAAGGLNLAWFCTHEYPTTQYVFKKGAADEERFKLWTRAYQRPTQVFFSAYPDLSVALVNQNSWICRGLHAGGEPAPSDAAAWVRRLG